MDVTLDPDLDLATLKNNFNIISQSVNHVPWNVYLYLGSGIWGLGFSFDFGRRTLDFGLII